MLALIKNDQFVRQVHKGIRFDIDGMNIMPPIAGWQMGEYSLHDIQPAEPVPTGKVVVATDVVQVDYLWTFVHRLQDIPPLTIQELLQHNEQKRWDAENGGVEFGGMNIASDDRSKTMLLGARIKADADSSFTTDWKAPNGAFITIDAMTIIAISNAVLVHVDACFKKERAVSTDIEDGVITEFDQIDTAWATMV